MIHLDEWADVTKLGKKTDMGVKMLRSHHTAVRGRSKSASDELSLTPLYQKRAKMGTTIAGSAMASFVLWMCDSAFK